MASSDGVKTVSLVAATALTNGKLIEVTAAGLAGEANAGTDVIVGVCAETVSTGDSVPVAELQGILEVEAGGAITPGQLCVPDASGTVVAAADIASIPANSMAIGVALDTAALGDIFRVFATPLVGPAIV